MVQRQFVVSNPRGLHARPAGEIAKVAARFASDIYIHCNGGKTCNGKSVIHLVAACVGVGQSLVVEVAGPDEGAAMTALAQVIGVQLG